MPVAQDDVAILLPLKRCFVRRQDTRLGVIEIQGHGALGVLLGDEARQQSYQKLPVQSHDFANRLKRSANAAQDALFDVAPWEVGQNPDDYGYDQYDRSSPFDEGNRPLPGNEADGSWVGLMVQWQLHH